MSAQSKYYNTGGGELFFTPLVNGVLGTEAPFGGTENISFTSTVDNVTHDSTEASVTFEDKVILKKVTGKISIETVEISPEMLEKAFLGSYTPTTISAQTAQAYNVTVSAFDTALDVGVKKMSNVVVKDSSDTTTYVENTDYTLDLEAGTITVLTSGGTIAVNDVLHVTADNASYTWINIEGFMNSKLEGELRFVSKPANGVAYVYTFHKVSLLASGDYSLKSSDAFSKLSFEGSMLASELITDPTKSKLFSIEGMDVA